MTDTNKSTAPLEAFGLLVRQTRLKRHLTQQRAARGAGVSRQQWERLEQGQNVSAVFMQKVATFLDLRVIPLDGIVGTMMRGAGVDVGVLFRLADELVAFATLCAERLRTFAIEAALPPSERAADASAELATFFAKIANRSGEAADPDYSQRFSRSIEHLVEDVGRGVLNPTVVVKRTTKRRKKEA